MSNVVRLSWPEVAALDVPEQQYVIAPFLPKPGITLFYGKSGYGKTPFTWAQAYAVGTGTPFFGMPVTPGRVLYLELDTPQNSVLPRLKKLTPADNVDFIFSPPFDIRDPKSHRSILKQIQAKPEPPDFVIVNTLRKLYTGDERDGAIPSEVYSILLEWFPQAAIEIVHHDHKSAIVRKGDNPPEPRESFSGHMAWLNDCQSAIRVAKREAEENDDESVLRIRVTHEKNQAGPMSAPLPLILRNGWQWTHEDMEARKRQLVEALAATASISSITQRLLVIGRDHLGVSSRTVRRYLKDAGLENRLAA